MADDPAVTVALWCSDIEATASFLYEATGMVATERHPGYARLVHREAMLVLHGDEAFRGHPWYEPLAREGITRGIGAEIRIAVVDVEDAHRRALAAGAVTVVSPYETGAGLECQVMGPDGYLFALHSGIQEV